MLEIFFSEAHAFQDREVRTYLLMAGLIGEAMSHAAQLEERKNLTAEVPTTPHAIEQTQRGSFSTTVDLRQAEQTSMRSTGIAEPPMAVATELPVSTHPASLATMIMQRAKAVTLHNRRWNVALPAVATVLMLTCWIAYRGRRPASPLGSSALPRSTAIEQQEPFPTKAMPAKNSFKVQPTPVPVKEARSARAKLQRVRAREMKVDYFGDDVTVRYFTLKLAPRRVQVGKTQIVYIGDDVTVHHFTSR